MRVAQNHPVRLGVGEIGRIAANPDRSSPGNGVSYGFGSGRKDKTQLNRTVIFSPRQLADVKSNRGIVADAKRDDFVSVSQLNGGVSGDIDSAGTFIIDIFALGEAFVDESDRRNRFDPAGADNRRRGDKIVGVVVFG